VKALTYAVADLHGCFALFTAARATIEAHAQDAPGTVVFLGDYIDRGPQSREVVEALIEGPAGDWKWIALSGNHERILLAVCAEPRRIGWWLANGGGATLLSYGQSVGDIADPGVIPAEHRAWLAALPLMHVTSQRIYVHAGVDPELPLDGQDPEQLVWKRYLPSDRRGHRGRHVVHGHEQYVHGPLLTAGRTGLDTGAYYTGRLVVGVFDEDLPGGPTELIEVTA